MIYQRDWLMRQIQGMTGAILQFVFHESGSASEQSEIWPSAAIAIGEPYETLLVMLQKGQFCQAENLLFDELDENDVTGLHLAVNFYSELNKFSDEVLEAHNFPREEIQAGLEEACRMYGFDAKLFGG